MQAMIDELAKQAAESLGQVSSKETLASFWQEYLSKNGKIPALMKNLRTVAPEERRHGQDHQRTQAEGAGRL